MCACTAKRPSRCSRTAFVAPARHCTLPFPRPRLLYGQCGQTGETIAAKSLVCRLAKAMEQRA